MQKYKVKNRDNNRVREKDRLMVSERVRVNFYRWGNRLKQ